MAGFLLMHAQDPSLAGQEMFRLAERLYPICRSITGNGVRETLRILAERLPIEVREVPTGTEVFDWKVPREWNIREAWIKTRDGRTILDFRNSNLHVVGYSVPVHQTLSLKELKKHVHTLRDLPDAIPYRTSYYKEQWGFCLTHRQLESLEEGDYEVRIDSTLEAGSLTYGELLLPGISSEEVLISCHVCHPSLANDNLSGIAVAAALAERLAASDRRYSYRFLFIPGTIGSITWLALNESRVGRIKHGLVLTCLGDPGVLTYKKSRRDDAEIDRAAMHVLRHGAVPGRILEFVPYGYDERQYCSPGFNLPVGCMMRSQHGTFPEYHTSADNLSFIRPGHLADSLAGIWTLLQTLERNDVFENTNPKCEPALGKRGLYGSGGGARRGEFDELTLLWVLNLADGTRDLLSIADRAGVAFSRIAAAAVALEQAGLLRRLALGDSRTFGNP